MASTTIAVKQAAVGLAAENAAPGATVKTAGHPAVVITMAASDTKGSTTHPNNANS